MSEKHVAAETHAKSALDAARRRGHFWPKEFNFFNEKLGQSQLAAKDIGTNPAEMAELQRHMPAPSKGLTNLLDVLPW